jgi:hypothetical protein
MPYRLRRVALQGLQPRHVQALLPKLTTEPSAGPKGLTWKHKCISKLLVSFFRES